MLFSFEDLSLNCDIIFAFFYYYYVRYTMLIGIFLKLSNVSNKTIVRGAVGVRDCYSPLIKGKRRGTGESLKYIRVMKIGESRGLEK